MKILFVDEAWEDYVWWHENERKMITRINRLIRDMRRSPYEGLGNPEPLRHDLSGFWSRRIDQEHRLVYVVDEDVITILQVRHHYLGGETMSDDDTNAARIRRATAKIMDRDAELLARLGDAPDVPAAAAEYRRRAAEILAERA